MAFRLRYGYLAAALVAAPLAVSAQGGQQTPAQQQQQQQQKAQKQLQTGELLSTIHEINQNEIAGAQLAIRKAQSPEVKAAAQTLLQDHRQLDQKVTQLAQQKQIALKAPTTFTGRALDRANQTQAEHLQQLSGAQFDTAFISAQPYSHRFALAVIDGGLQAPGQDPQVRQLLDQARAKVASHLQTADQLLQQKVRVAQVKPHTQGG